MTEQEEERLTLQDHHVRSTAFQSNGPSEEPETFEPKVKTIKMEDIDANEGFIDFQDLLISTLIEIARVFLKEDDYAIRTHGEKAKKKEHKDYNETLPMPSCSHEKN